MLDARYRASASSSAVTSEVRPTSISTKSPPAGFASKRCAPDAGNTSASPLVERTAILAWRAVNNSGEGFASETMLRSMRSTPPVALDRFACDSLHRRAIMSPIAIFVLEMMTSPSASTSSSVGIGTALFVVSQRIVFFASPSPIRFETISMIRNPLDGSTVR